MNSHRPFTSSSLIVTTVAYSFSSVQLLVLFPVPAAAVNPPKNSKDEEHFESVL